MTNRNDIEQLFKAHYAQMYRLAVALLHDDDLARDIVHDVFVSLLDATCDTLISGGYLLKAV
ncbi:sigma factor [uncultured Duncaniella sp.]|uniref:RNA polymerase sigma factor n=1 Tax=uncultured Duncaniella sp. TaxID=2768039 RepID=UPI0025A99F71|nr:sigma factor [uncultured Duncaniella sp.]